MVVIPASAKRNVTGINRPPPTSRLRPTSSRWGRVLHEGDAAGWDLDADPRRRLLHPVPVDDRLGVDGLRGRQRVGGCAGVGDREEEADVAALDVDDVRRRLDPYREEGPRPDGGVDAVLTDGVIDASGPRSPRHGRRHDRQRRRLPRCPGAPPHAGRRPCRRRPVRRAGRILAATRPGAQASYPTLAEHGPALPEHADSQWGTRFG